MPHRFISVNILDIILGIIPATLVGVFDFDKNIIAHMIGCYTGALIKWGYDVKIKKMDKPWATFYAVISLGAGFIIGNSVADYFKIATVSHQILGYMISAIAANYLVYGLIKIFIQLEAQSWTMSRDYIKKALKDWINSK